jgi:predicted lipoprotein with Yx(FWY)xxD motif
MMTIEEMGRTRASGRRLARAGALVALAAGATLLVAACSSGSAAGAGGAASAAAATAAPATATTDLTGGGGYGGGAAATQAPAASAGAEGTEAYEVGVGTDAAVGSFLTGEGGRTLYVFTKDSPGTTVCYDQCAVNWPPFTLEADGTIRAAAGVTGTFGTITRSDGSTQVTYKDQPLYYYVADRKAGEVTGQGVGGVWFVAAP